MLCYESKAITDVGNKRKINQDSFAQTTDYINNTYIGIYCVADGMGGLTDGEYASRLAVTETVKWYKKNIKLFAKKNSSAAKIRKSLKEIFYYLNSEIYQYGITNNIKVGTTYSLLLMIGNKYFVIHAGDSRIYLKRGNRLYLLTKDQTWVNEQVEKGFMSREQAENHPKKNVLANCMGCFESPSVCIGGGTIEKNDCFLICSDGLYNLTTTEEISQGMSCTNLEYTSEEFIRLVKERGAYDNVTILMVRACDEADEIMTTVRF